MKVDKRVVLNDLSNLLRDRFADHLKDVVLYFKYKKFFESTHSSPCVICNLLCQSPDNLLPVKLDRLFQPRINAQRNRACTCHTFNQPFLLL